MRKVLPYALVSPYLLYLAVFVAFPVAFSVWITFYKWNIIGDPVAVGFDNYIRLIHDRLFWKSIANTLKFLVLHIPLQIAVALGLAVLLDRPLRGRAFYRGAYFLPVIVSGVVVTILWQQLLATDGGLLNRLLIGVGLPRVGWLVDPDVAMYAIAVMATWKNVGLYVILFLAGLQSVPGHYYEAAKLEGASEWQQFRFVTLPAINPTLFAVVVLSTIGGFSLFIEPYVLTGGGPLNSTLSAVLYIYKQAFQYYHMGYAATLGLAFSLLIVAVVIIQQKLVEQPEEA